jgi:hypothetical protein
MEDILIGTTDRTVLVFVSDPASTTGAGKTGLAAAAVTVTYTRVETDNDVVHSDVTSSLTDLSALTDAHADWGWKEVSATLSKGLYRLDIADAVFAAGAWYAVVQVTITSGTAAATPKAFRLVSRNDLDGVRLGLTALPDAAADAAGGLPVSDAGGLDLDAKVGALTFTVAGKVDANATHISGDSVAADNAEAFFDGTGYAGTNNVIPTVTTLTNLPAITANWLTAAGTAADFGTEVGTAVWATATRVLTAGTNVDGSTFTAIPWAAAWDAEVQSEVADALTAFGVSTYAGGAVASVTGTVGGIAGTTTTLDALQAALNSAHGAGSWATATGFSTHSAADVWAVGTRTITGGSLTTAPPTAAAIATAWGARELSGGVTADDYLQGYLPKIVFDATGLTATIYAGDETTVVQSLTATRLATSVGGVRTIDPA